MISTVLEFERVVQLLRDEPTARLTVDFHRDATAHQLAITLSAFANMPDGGTLVVRIGSQQQPSQLRQLIDHLAKQEVEPSVRLAQQHVSGEQHDAVLVRIFGRLEPIADIHRVSATGHAYRRTLAGNVQMSRAELLEATRLDRDATDLRGIAGSTLAHLDPTRTARFLAVVRDITPDWKQLSDTEVLQRKGVVTPTGTELTVAGCYVLGRYPQAFFPRVRIAARSTSDAQVETVHFDGGLPEQIERAVRWVVRHARGADARALDGRGYRGSEIPISVIRELITNAVVHRALDEQAIHHEIQLALTAGNLTVKSPGGMFSVHPSALGTSEQHVPVNPAVYELCRLTPTTGGHRVVTPGALGDAHIALLKTGMCLPHTVDTGTSTVASVGRRLKFTAEQRDWLKAVTSPHSLTSAQQILLVMLRDGGPERVTGLAGRSRTLQKNLTALHELGLVHLPDGVRHAYGLAIPAGQAPRHPLPDAARSAERAASPSSSADPEIRVAATSKHGAKLWAALGEGAENIHDIAEIAGLNLAKTRYAMQRLVAAGLVERTGGQGHRETSYTRV